MAPRRGRMALALFVLVLLASALAEMTFTPSAWTTRPHHAPDRARVLHNGVPYHALHSMPPPRAHFAEGPAPHPDTPHEVVIAVTQNNLAALDVLLQQRAHPRSPTYRQWLTREEVAAHTANPGAIAAIQQWCKQEGIDITWTAPRGELIRATAPISTWNKALRADFREFADTHPDSSLVKVKAQRRLEGQGDANNAPKSTTTSTPEPPPYASSSSSSAGAGAAADGAPSATILRSRHVFLPAHLMDHIAGLHQTTQIPPLLAGGPRFHSDFASASAGGAGDGAHGAGSGSSSAGVGGVGLKGGKREQGGGEDMRGMGDMGESASNSRAERDVMDMVGGAMEAALSGAVVANLKQHLSYIEGESADRNLLHIPAIAKLIRADTRKRHDETRGRMQQQQQRRRAKLTADTAAAASATTTTAGGTAGTAGVRMGGRTSPVSPISPIKVQQQQQQRQQRQKEEQEQREEEEEEEEGEEDPSDPDFHSRRGLTKFIKSYQSKCTSTASTSITLGTYCMNPKLLKYMYNITQGGVQFDPKDTTALKTSMQVFATIGQYYSLQDQYLFNARWNSSTPTYTGSAVNGHVVTGSCPTMATCQEANLNVQYAMAIGKGAPTTFVYIDGGIWDHFLVWVYQAVRQSPPADVHSISYGALEINIDALSMYSFAVEAMKLSVMGVTIVVASGDDGAPGKTTTDGLETCNCEGDSSSAAYNKEIGWATTHTWDSMGGYFPLFPASCPYVTTVGGLASMATDYRWCAITDDAPTSAPTATADFTAQSPTRAPTSANARYTFTFCDPSFTSGRLTGVVLKDAYRRVEFMADTFTGNAKITSGGGFSAYWDRPSWQDEPVAAYIAATNLNLNAIPMGFNYQGRGYPDISLQAVNYEFIVANGATLADGTSASAPVFAGMVVLLNGIFKKHGLPTVGFLNPTLYEDAYSSLYTDIDNSYGDGPQNHCCGTFSDNTVTCCYEPNPDYRSDPNGVSTQGRAIGFTTQPGWDPATGLGSISLTRLEYMFNNLLSGTPSSPDAGTWPPTVAPTLRPSGETPKPTKVPTAAPTEGTSYQWLAVTQSLTGVDIAALVDPKQAPYNALALRKTWAKIIGLKVETIYIESASDGTKTYLLPTNTSMNTPLATAQSSQPASMKKGWVGRRLYVISPEQGARGLDSAVSITAVMWGNLTGLTPEYAAGKIDAAVVSGTYKSLLQTNAALSAAVALVNADGIKGSTSEYRQPSIAPTVSPKALSYNTIVIISLVLLATALLTVSLIVLYREGYLDKILGRKGYHRHEVCGVRGDVADGSGHRRYLRTDFDFAGVHSSAEAALNRKDNDSSHDSDFDGWSEVDSANITGNSTHSHSSNSSGSSSAFGAEMFAPAVLQSAKAREASLAAGWRVRGDKSTGGKGKANKDIPAEYICPITFEIMRDPFIAADGCSYEKTAIDKYVLSGKTVSPTTGQPLKHQHLWPNAALKVQVERFTKSRALLSSTPAQEIEFSSLSGMA